MFGELPQLRTHVLPWAIFILWARRGAISRDFWAAGMGRFGAGRGQYPDADVRRRYYLDAADGWSILLWVGGVVWFLGGWRVFRWSLPAVVFLWFMVPLPFRMEHALSRPLQHAATHASCWILQCLGQPALAEGNVHSPRQPADGGGAGVFRAADFCGNCRPGIRLRDPGASRMVGESAVAGEHRSRRIGGERHADRGHGPVDSMDSTEPTPTNSSISTPAT